MKVLKNKKALIALVAVVVIACVAVSGTVAYFTDTSTATNTFTVGEVAIDLSETKSDFKMIPGTDIEKDPVVTVEADSVACYLFVKANESDGYSNYMSYTVNDGETPNGWTKGDGTKIPSNVYYREVEATTADTPFQILDGNKVHVKDSVTKAMMSDAQTNKPVLTFTAYACQKAGVADAAAAWEAIQAASN